MLVLEKAQTRGIDVGFVRKAAEISDKVKMIIPNDYINTKLFLSKFPNATSISLRGEIVLKNKDITRGPAAPYVAGKINGGIDVWTEAISTIKFQPFEIIRVKTNGKEETPTQLESLNFLKACKLYSPEIIFFTAEANSLSFVKDKFLEWSNSMSEPLDGVVYCSSLWQYPRCLAETTATVYGKYAWKPHTEVHSILRNINYDIAKDGKINLIFEYDPIKVSNKNYSRAKVSISRLKILEGIGIGSDITVKLAGDIIPVIEDFNFDERIQAYSLPEKCPFCNAKTKLKECKISTTFLCTNSDCIGAKQQKMIYFFKTLQFKGIAEKKIEKLENRLALSTVLKDYDIYDSFRECLRKTTVRELFVALNFGGARSVEKMLKSTVLKDKMLFQIFTCLDEIVECVHATNEFAEEIIDTIYKLWKK
jgi:NAD-dependent DNA ligase